MRLLKILLTALLAAFALVAGFFIAAFGVLAIALGRLLGGSNRIRIGRARTPHARGQPAAATTAAEAKNPASGEVIDVTATEVPTK